MIASADLSILSLVTKATLVVQLVMALLLVVSLASWTVIFGKGFSIRRARKETDGFERDFWSGAELSALYQKASNRRHRTCALERIFESGMSEFLKLRGRDDSQATLDGSRRAMRASYQREMDALEGRLQFLASVGSVSPYIGLFGTVVGIMKAFHQIAIEGSGGFAVVAAGISEALIATAVGLGVAILALTFYNYLNVKIGLIGNGFARACERLVQALLYVESSTQPVDTRGNAPEVGRGHPLPA